MRLLITTVTTTLQGASLEIITAITAAMRVFELHGYKELRLTRYYRFTNMNDPKRRQHERLEITHEGTAIVQSICQHLAEQLNEIAHIEKTATTINIITVKPC